MVESFTDEELGQLKTHKIVIFANRVIFDAQPPMTNEDMSTVESYCSGGLPPALKELWSQTAGGRLDYELTVRMNDGDEAISWSELFYNGSNNYHDLEGWIAHEKELAADAAAEAGEEWNGKLDFLPIGGFEYCDRIYVGVSHEKQGQILAWKQGLPPAWTHRLHVDAVGVLANDLHSAFELLSLEEDPRTAVSRFPAGESFLEYIEERIENDLPRELAEKLIEYFCRAQVNWEEQLQNGTISKNHKVARVALKQAIERDDPALICDLARSGVDLQSPVVGALSPIEHAVFCGRYFAAQALCDANVPIAKRILSDVHDAIPSQLVTSLLERGAEPCVDAMVMCAACGAMDSARIIMEACSSTKSDGVSQFTKKKSVMLKELNKDLKEVRLGTLFHELGEEGLTERIKNLESFKIKDRSWLASAFLPALRSKFLRW